MNPKEILKTNAGALVSRKVRSTGAVVTLYSSKEANLDEEDGPYHTVCENHSYLVGHKNKTTALGWLSRPEDWCSDCSELMETKNDRR